MICASNQKRKCVKCCMLSHFLLYEKRCSQTILHGGKLLVFNISFTFLFTTSLEYSNVSSANADLFIPDGSQDQDKVQRHIALTCKMKPDIDY